MASSSESHGTHDLNAATNPMTLNKKGLEAAHAAYAKTTGGMLEGHPMANAITAYLSAVSNSEERRRRAAGPSEVVWPMADPLKKYKDAAQTAPDGLEAAKARLDDMAGMRNIPSVLTRSGREFIAEKTIRAYLSATALPDGMEVEPWPLGGYAPGNYTCMCLTCKVSFTGDKRAYQCLPCAASQAQSALAAMRVERDEALEAENEAKDCFWTIYPRCLELGGEPVSTEAARTDLAAQVQRLTEENEGLRKERDEADNALVDKYRDPKTGHFNFPSDVAAIIRRLDAREARIKALEEALGPFADKPDDWTVDQVNAARLALKNQESDRED